MFQEKTEAVRACEHFETGRYYDLTARFYVRNLKINLKNVLTLISLFDIILSEVSFMTDKLYLFFLKLLDSLENFFDKKVFGSDFWYIDSKSSFTNDGEAHEAKSKKKL